MQVQLTSRGNCSRYRRLFCVVVQGSCSITRNFNKDDLSLLKLCTDHKTQTKKSASKKARTCQVAQIIQECGKVLARILFDSFIVVISCSHFDNLSNLLIYALHKRTSNSHLQTVTGYILSPVLSMPGSMPKSNQAFAASAIHNRVHE